MRKLFTLLMLIIISAAISGISWSQESLNRVFQDLLKSAVGNNAGIQAERAQLAVYRARSAEAQAAYFPSVDINARYTRADGGREMRFDINDLIPSTVIPVDIPETVIPFLRETEHETKVSVTQPVFQGGAILYNNKMKREELRAEQAKYHTSVRNLTVNVISSALQYLQTKELISIKKGILNIASENLRTVNRLHAVDKVALNEVKRAEVQEANAQQELMDAENSSVLSLQVLNNYLGRGPDEKPDVPDKGEIALLLQEALHADISFSQLYRQAENNRPEFVRMDHLIGAASAAGKINRSNYLPKIAFAFDYGFQGEKYKFDDRHDYWMASLVGSWNLFSGFRTNAVSRQIKAQEQSLKKSRVDMERNIRIQVRSSLLNMKNSINMLHTSEKQVESAAENFRIVKRQYEEGLAPQITLIDAQNTLNIARSNKTVKKYQLLIHYAVLMNSAGLIKTEF